MVFGLFKNYPIFRYIIYDFLKKVSRGSRPTCLAKILCAQLHFFMGFRVVSSFTEKSCLLSTVYFLQKDCLLVAL